MPERPEKLAGARRVSAERPYSRVSRPVSRVLEGMQIFFACVTAIPLGRRSPGASSNLPGRPDPDTIPKRMLAHDFAPSLFGLAPGGVCHAAAVTVGAVRSYRTFSPLPQLNRRRGGMFSVALSLGSHPPDVIRHHLSAEPGLSSVATFRFCRSGRPTD